MGRRPKAFGGDRQFTCAAGRTVRSPRAIQCRPAHAARDVRLLVGLGLDDLLAAIEPFGLM
jgi:hypothetical protein